MAASSQGQRATREIRITMTAATKMDFIYLSEPDMIRANENALRHRSPLLPLLLSHGATCHPERSARSEGSGVPELFRGPLKSRSLAPAALGMTSPSLSREREEGERSDKVLPHLRNGRNPSLRQSIGGSVRRHPFLRRNLEHHQDRIVNLARLVARLQAANIFRTKAVNRGSVLSGARNRSSLMSERPPSRWA